jgi:hypothetical protein
VLAAVSFGPARAFGEGTVDRCVDANTRAQSLRHDERLGEAREMLKRCADPACPDLVRDDCTQLLDDLDRAQPTIVFDAKDEAGRDLSAVNVLIDGHPFAERLEGIAVPADPGAHTFTFETRGHPAVTRELVIREGEKNRRERVVLTVEPGPTGALSPAASAPLPAPPTSAPAAPPALGTQRTGALAVAAAGLVGLGTGAALALLAKSKSDDANAYCPRADCPNAQALTMNRDALILANAATVAFIAGAAGVAAAGLLWWTARPSSVRPSAALGLGGPRIVFRATW